MIDRIRAMDPGIAGTHDTKERFEGVWDATGLGRVRARYEDWRATIPADLADTFAPVTTAVDAWRDELFADRDEEDHRRYLADVRGLIAEINKSGRGYRFKSLRVKFLYGADRDMPDARDRGGPVRRLIDALTKPPKPHGDGQGAGTAGFKGPRKRPSMFRGGRLAELARQMARDEF